jgi:hypothetical protein
MITIRPSRRGFRLLVLLTCAVGLLGTGAPAAVAAPIPRPGDTPPATGTLSWAVAPSNAAGTDTRSHFDFTNLKPGAVVDDYVGITNYSPYPVNFTIYATDGITTTAGSLGLAAATQRPVDVGAWVRPLHSSVTVPARSRLNEPFAMELPANATPGDHAGGIVASVTQTSGPGQVKQEDRVGVAIYLRVAGPLHPALTVESAGTSGYHGTPNPFGGGGTDVTYIVHNTGNVRLAGGQTVRVTGLFGIPLATAHPAALEEMLPGGQVQVTAHLSGVYPAGWLTAHVDVTAKLVPGSPPMAVAAESGSASVGFWATPWALLLLLLLLGAAGFGGWRWLRQRRRRHATALAAALERGRREEREQLAKESA